VEVRRLTARTGWVATAGDSGSLGFLASDPSLDGVAHVRPVRLQAIRGNVARAALGHRWPGDSALRPTAGNAQRCDCCI